MNHPEESARSDINGRTPVIHPELLHVGVEPYQINVDRRNALSRALTPGYAGLDPTRYADITFDMIDHVKPVKLEEHLIGVPRPTKDHSQPCVLSYDAGPGRRELYIAVTPQEARLIPRSVGAIRRAARLTTASTVTTEFPTDSDLAREERSGRHVHESKLAVLRKFQTNVYGPQLQLLDKFIEASTGRHVGLGRFGNEVTFREAINTLQTAVFGDMVRAYARQRALSAEQTRQVERAITASMYFDRQDNRHIRNFHALVKFSRAYVGHKSAAVEQRIQAITDQLKQDV